MMEQSTHAELEKWVAKASENGLVDIKFAIDDSSFATREVIDGFLASEQAIENGNVLACPQPNGEPSAVTRETLAELA
ncbi:MAG: hypothetical protein KAJ19_04995 [Gammaproteobacteria bacterium]|nr:hypothetical protein [Gammaproteobacteria bacterium]